MLIMLVMLGNSNWRDALCRNAGKCARLRFVFLRFMFSISVLRAIDGIELLANARCQIVATVFFFFDDDCRVESMLSDAQGLSMANGRCPVDNADLRPEEPPKSCG